jgi:hypothetical protein
MANPSIKKLAGPAAFATSATNLYTPSGTTTYDIIKHVHIVNTTAGALTFSLFLSQSTGVETAGKELFVNLSVPANSVYDYYCNLKLIAGTDFLVGHASAVTMTFTVEGETYAI